MRKLFLISLAAAILILVPSQRKGDGSILLTCVGIERKGDGSILVN